MEPTEIDEIIRAAYGKIYDGNVKDQQKLMDDYFENYKYKEHIYHSSEAEIEPVTGEDLELTMKDAKETAAGLDQMVHIRPRWCQQQELG